MRYDAIIPCQEGHGGAADERNGERELPLLSARQLSGGVVELFRERHFHHSGFYLAGRSFRTALDRARSMNYLQGQCSYICATEEEQQEEEDAEEDEEEEQEEKEEEEEEEDIRCRSSACSQQPPYLRGYHMFGHAREGGVQREVLLDREVGPEHVKLGADPEVGADRAHLRFDREAVDDGVAGSLVHHARDVGPGGFCSPSHMSAI